MDQDNFLSSTTENWKRINKLPNIISCRTRPELHFSGFYILMLVSMCNLATTAVTNDNYLYEVLVYPINITSAVGTNDNYFY